MIEEINKGRSCKEYGCMNKPVSQYMVCNYPQLMCGVINKIKERKKYTIKAEI